MGALAQFVSWIPEDDLLLKNAIEVISRLLFPFFITTVNRRPFDAPDVRLSHAGSQQSVR